MAKDRKSMPKIHRGVLSEAMASANRCRGIVRTSNFLRLDMLCVLTNEHEWDLLSVFFGNFKQFYLPLTTAQLNQ